MTTGPNGTTTYTLTPRLNGTIIASQVTGSSGMTTVELAPEAFYAVVLPYRGLIPTAPVFQYGNITHASVFHVADPVPGTTYHVEMGIRDTIDATKSIIEPIALY